MTIVAVAALLLLQPPSEDAGFFDRLIAAAVDQTRHPGRYDGSYRRIPYPSGDVPAGVGVCTDVVIRAYRAVGVDLQQSVHEDMRAAFAESRSSGAFRGRMPTSTIGGSRTCRPS